MDQCMRLGGAVLAVVAISMSTPATGASQELKIVGGPDLPYGQLIGNGGFEDGFARPWGTWVEHEPGPLWSRRGECAAEAAVDTRVKKSGQRSLRISNPSRKARGCYAETCQVMVTEPDRRYRLAFWARYEQLASDGAIRFLVGLPGAAAEPWKTVIELPAGSHDWQKFQGEFSFPATVAELRIRSADRGQVWLDDIHVTPVEPDDDLLPAANTDEQGLAPDALAKAFGQPLRVTAAADAHHKEPSDPAAASAAHPQHSDEAFKRALTKVAAAVTPGSGRWSDPYQPFPGLDCPFCRVPCRLFTIDQRDSAAETLARRELRVPPSRVILDHIFVAQHRLPGVSSRIVTAPEEPSSGRQVFHSTVLDDRGKKIYVAVQPSTFRPSRSTTVGSTDGSWSYGSVTYRCLLDATTVAFCGISFRTGSDTPHWTSWQPEEYVRHTEPLAKTVFRVLREELQIEPEEEAIGLFFPYGR